MKGIYKHPIGEQSSHYKHGLSSSRLYRIWSNMKTRCYNNKSNNRLDWQRKGIKVCDEWKNSFQAFYDWSMSNGYQDNLTLDRINNDGNYEPSNCRWATYSEQNNNKDSVPTYEYKGITFQQFETEKLFGIKRTTFQRRIYKGMSVIEAIETPVRKVV